MAQQGLIPGVQFYDLTDSDLKDPKLTLLNQTLRQIVSSMGILAGSQGKLLVNVTMDMQNNIIENVILAIPSSQSSSSATAGSASLPANPAGFLILTVGGKQVKVPYYNS